MVGNLITLGVSNMVGFVLESLVDGSIFGDRSFYIKSHFKSEAAAKAAMTRYAKKFGENDYGRTVFKPENYKITDMATYVEPTVTRTKRFPGTGETRTYTIGINSVGTCTDPATETYWSM